MPQEDDISTIGVLTILPKVELAATLLAFGRSPDDPPDIRRDECRYWIVFLNNSDGRKLRIVISCVGNSGNTEVVGPTESMIRHFKPESMLLIGVACGIREFSLGDVVTSAGIWAYEYVKTTKDGVLDRSRLQQTSPHILRDVSFYTAHLKWIEQLVELQSKIPPKMAPRKTLGEPRLHENILVASGEKVLANGELKKLHTKYNLIRAGEMEGYGFVKGCNSVRPITPCMVIRGISDYGDRDKDGGLGDDAPLKDEFHYVSALAAATFARSFLETAYSAREEPSGTKTEEKLPKAEETKSAPASQIARWPNRKTILNAINLDLEQWASMSFPEDPFLTRIRFWRILQSLLSVYTEQLRVFKLPVLGTNIMFLRRQNGASSSWTMTLREADLYWGNDAIWMCIVLENAEKVFVRSHEFSKYYCFLANDEIKATTKRRLGLNGRTLQELFLLNGTDSFSFPSYLTIERHAEEYNKLRTKNSVFDRKTGYGIRITENYAALYDAKSKDGYQRGLSITKASTVNAIVNIPVFAPDKFGNVRYVLGLVNADFYEPIESSEDLDHFLVEIQMSFNRAFRLYIERCGQPMEDVSFPL
ncbi:hypothetical protein [Afipia clevelandensis]|uniref:Nucleoside phosphorylase domain-containing protein n=1 Tax=Afipia clevelandensis ATCC 49720 TaxID=883079 RepID=K8NZ23_9BRAD|nr:hypothetical protein [Afipia clevelandensis]EKS32660.1 hypothetical protein HMPREF9696_03637 [Afipia clevelandensis ATCC 49720]